MPKRENVSNSSEVSSKKPKTSGHWATGLLQTMKDPKYIVKKDDKITVIRDMYPKAEFHYLVLPNEDLGSLKALNKGHVGLLKHMDEVAKKLVEEEHPNKVFNMGYHSEASMFRLHLHVISDDMNSVCVKTKKHWNSFCSDFFLKSSDVIDNLEKNGKVELPSKEICKRLIESPLKCHKCTFVPKHMPDLKKHILTHCK